MDWSRRYVLLVLVIFASVSGFRHRNVIGEDLSSSYVGCKLLAAGESSHLYRHNAGLFNKVSDPLWDEVGKRAGFIPIELLHPYVQTPLWSYALEPLCTRLNFPQFDALFMALGMIAISASIWLVAQFWAPNLMHPGWIALIVSGLYISQPFRYALFLNQTHVLFLFLTIAALILAHRGHPVAAGVLLAIAAAVKVTPGFLVLYWLLNRQMRAALSFAVSSVLLVAVAVLTCGLTVMEAYFSNMRYLSNVLLVAFNNQSFDAWLLEHKYPVDYFVWHIYKLPVFATVLSFLLTIGLTILGGIWDRKLYRRALEGENWRPVGAVMAMLAATMCAPIAWTHYFILLVLPIMLMLDENLRRKSPTLTALVVGIFALNLYPIAIESASQHVMRFSVVRSQFYAGLLALWGLRIVYTRARERVSPPTTLPRQAARMRATQGDLITSRTEHGEGFASIA